MKKVIIVFLATVFLFGCTNPGGNGTGNNPNVPETPAGKLPGKFSATVLSDAMGSNARGVSLGTYTVANSKSIYFLLRNVGDFPITNIALTPGKLLNEGETFKPITDNGITASPSVITVLETSGKATVEAVIEVDINHGNIIGLISQLYIHKADFAGTTLRITGKTTDEEGSVLDISLDADIETLIKVASFELRYSQDNGVTWEKASGTSESIQWFRFLIPSNGQNYVKILNTGNVPLRYKARQYDDGGIFELCEWKNLNSGEYSENLRYSWENGVSVFGTFIIDTIGVAFDNEGIDIFKFRPNTSIIGAGSYDQSRIHWETYD